MQAPSNQSLCLESDFHQWEFSELAHSELKLFFFSSQHLMGPQMIVYWSIWDLKNSQIWRKASPKQDLRRLQKDYETHLKSSTSSHKQALSKESRIWLDWKWDSGRIRNNMSPSTLFPVNEVSTLQSYCLFFVLFLFPFERQCFCVESNKDWAAHQQTQTTVLGRGNI